MFCGYPVDTMAGLRPCGKCQGCLRQRRRAWIGRMLAEQTQHEECSFLTLTYSDDNLPVVRDPETDLWHPTLHKKHLQKFLRKTRKKIAPWGKSLRHFACGEYGTKTGRPHYHIIAFGLGVGANGLFNDIWQMGYVSTYEATARTMAYVSKYCLKGSSDGEPKSPTFTIEEPERLTEKPFRLMSNRPPIGAALSKNIARSMATPLGDLLKMCDSHHLKRSFKMGKDTYPLDRTTRMAVKKHLAISDVLFDALYHLPMAEPTDEEIEKAALSSDKALRQRHKKTKL